MRLIDRTGARYGRLTVLRPAEAIGAKRAWLCECACGAKTVVVSSNLVTGNTASCGCVRREKTLGRCRTHGRTRTPEYRAWSQAIQRCTNPKNPRFRLYGARGIRVCKRWHASFEAFLSDMGPRPSPHLSIDRINNDGNYEPGNCRWATRSEQAKNQRRKAS